MSKITRAAALFTIAALFSLAPAGAQTPEDDEKVVLRMGMTNEIDSLNPFKLLEIPSFEISALNYNLLVEFSDEDFSPTPGLADSWETSDDGLEWTFHINPDANFQDG